MAGLISHENLNQKQQSKFEETFTLLLKTGKAWGFNEALRDLWDQDSAMAATNFFNEWYRRVSHTRLEPMKTVDRSIKERLVNVVSYCTHHITNGVAERLNSKIMSIKRRVGGFRNRQNFQTDIFSFCRGLDLYPH